MTKCQFFDPFVFKIACAGTCSNTNVPSYGLFTFVYVCMYRILSFYPTVLCMLACVYIACICSRIYCFNEVQGSSFHEGA